MPCPYRNVVNMARKKSYRRYARKGRKFLTGGGGSFSPIIQGVIAGVAEQVGARFLPGYGDEVGLGLAWYMTKNPALGTILGLRLSQLIPLGAVGLGATQAGNTVGGYA